MKVHHCSLTVALVVTVGLILGSGAQGQLTGLKHLWTVAGGAEHGYGIRHVHHMHQYEYVERDSWR